VQKKRNKKKTKRNKKTRNAFRGSLKKVCGSTEIRKNKTKQNRIFAKKGSVGAACTCSLVAGPDFVSPMKNNSPFQGIPENCVKLRFLEVSVLSSRKGDVF
jgi:hypothetical protein